MSSFFERLFASNGNISIDSFTPPELLNTAGQKMKGPDQLSAIEQVAAEFDNISVAWGWYVEQGRITMLIRQMLPGLYRYSYTRSTEEELLSLIRAASSALARGCAIWSRLATGRR